MEGERGVLHDTEDKNWWVKHGLLKEYRFVSDLAPRAGLQATINPDKRNNPYAPDLVIDSDMKLADLKCQNTPFFKAQELYNIAPTFAVTFNVKDFDKYSKDYPAIEIVFWVKWEQLSLELRGQTYRVDYLEGVWRCSFSEIRGWVANRRPHSYSRRKDDHNGNAKDSYVLDLRSMQRLL